MLAPTGLQQKKTLLPLRSLFVGALLVEHLRVVVMARTGAGGRLPGVAGNAIVDVAAVLSLRWPREELLFRLRHLVARRKHEPFLCKCGEFITI